MYDRILDSERGRTGLRKVVEHYRRIYVACEEEDRRYYKSLDLDKAIYAAGHLLRHDDQRHDHAQTCSGATLDLFTGRLQARAAHLAGHDVFPTVHETVVEAAGGSLAPHLLYDAALMLSWHLGFEPAEVWLHSGTEKGYLALGVPEGHGKTTVAIGELPHIFRELDAWQVEDILCIYKRCFRRIRNGGEVTDQLLSKCGNAQGMRCKHPQCPAAG
ncbi:hypothetical protein [Streptomyces sp. Isolate_45]|uniref:hypothetical protein n=1 Tax=Streptomyces sp. Isolate_45 TaxID=2950111 RepID=UPI002481CF77|nr:hypothetical protein [Streptomyces sp. Isolate_45]MDA5286410.1 hypothetical protein [Streptomyces sp. Isolate_45]